VRVETRLLPCKDGRSVESFSEEMLRSIAAVDPDADMASGPRERTYNFWTLVEAPAPELAAVNGVARVRDAALAAGGDVAPSNVWPSWARAESVEAYPSAEEDTDLALAG